MCKFSSLTNADFKPFFSKYSHIRTTAIICNLSHFSQFPAHSGGMHLPIHDKSRQVVPHTAILVEIWEVQMIIAAIASKLDLLLMIPPPKLPSWLRPCILHYFHISDQISNAWDRGSHIRVPHNGGSHQGSHKEAYHHATHS